MLAKLIRWNWILFAALLLASCNRKDDLSGGSMEENEVLAGTIVLTDGTPAANAEIRLYTVDHLPAKAGGVAKAGAKADLAFLVHTDAKGQYHIDSLAKGEYNILAADAQGGVSYRDSVFLAWGKKVKVTDTLRGPGSVRGVVALQPNHDPRTVTVQVLGTNSFTNVGPDGRFELKGMAAGRYTLRLETTLPAYTPLAAGMTVRAGRADTLPDTLRLIYTGIPVVRGLRVTVDTLAGIATVTWKPSDYLQLKDYLVERGIPDSPVPNPQASKITQDTVWKDTLYHSPGSIADPPSSWEYTVKVRDRGFHSGDAYEAVTIGAVPPAWAQTFLDFDVVGELAGGRASLHDTLKVVASFRNKTRGLTKVLWRLIGNDDPVRDIVLPAHAYSGSDTLNVVGQAYGNVGFLCQVADETNMMWEMPSQVSFAAFPPAVDAGPDTPAGHGDSITLQGHATTQFGQIVKWEWDIGNTGNFQESVAGKIKLRFPDSGFSTLTCVLRVTNSDGEASVDSLHVYRSLDWIKAANLPFSRSFSRLVVFKDRLWSIGGYPDSGAPGGIFSSGDGLTWRAEKDSAEVTARVDFAAFVLNDRLWVLGGNRNAGADNDEQLGDYWSTGDGVAWRKENSFVSGVFPNAKAAFSRGRVWVMGYMPQQLYSSADGLAWRSEQPIAAEMYNRQISWFFSLNENLILNLFSQGASDPNPGYLDIWKSQGGAGSWVRVGDGKASWRSHPSLANLLGRLWIMGGTNTASVVSTSDGIVWQADDPLPRPIHEGSAAEVFQGSIWVADHGEIFRSR